LYFHRPVLVGDLWKIDLEEGDDPKEVQKKVIQINACGSFNHALVDKEG